MSDLSGFFNAMVLVLVRISGIVVFAPFFSSTALPARAKVVFVAVSAFVLAPLVAALPNARPELSVSGLLGEIGVALVYGLVLAMLNEVLLFAGQLAGMQLSFSMVNLLDPTSSIQTPLMGDLFQLMGTLVLITAGLDRILLASLIRSFHAVPLGTYSLAPMTAHSIVQATAGVFLAAVELAAPLLSATILIEIAVALLSKLSPQLPVTLLTVPLKTLIGLAILASSVALWPRFIEARFSSLLDLAERLLQVPSVIGAGH